MKTLKKILIWTGLVILLLAGTAFTLYMIYLRPVMTKIMSNPKVIAYDKDLTLIQGGGGNSGILVSDSLVVIIDTKMDEPAEEMAKKVKELAGNKPILVVNTHYHPDHCKGNSLYKDASILAGGNYTKEQWIKAAGEETMPNLWLKDQMVLPLATDTLTILNLEGNAHTESDIVVYFSKRKLLFGGDVILNQQVPALRGAADPDGYLKAFEELPKQFDIQKVVPGHGPIGGMEIIQDFKQYFLDMQTAAVDASKKDELEAKYKDWTQVPFLMSTGATIDLMRKKMNK
jgi:glyoxylase-like metal-dependent hydrolase (beta-lactamase superfamily II)